MSTEENLPDHVLENRSFWDGMAEDWVSAGERSWMQTEPTWGIWAIPESSLAILPNTMAGMRAIELGCGTGYVSGWMARRGAEVTGIDNSEKQLSTARRLMSEHGEDIELIHGNAETVPKSDASYDFAISEYGAAIWCDPRVWIPEAARLLKVGGKLRFLGNHPMAVACWGDDGADPDSQLRRNYFDLHKLDWRNAEIDPGGVEFNLSIANWLSLFRECGFQVEDYVEIRCPDDRQGKQFGYDADWARQWPAEQVWYLTKAG